MAQDLLPVRLPARDVPPPSTISDAARAALATMAANPVVKRPDPEDQAGWRAAVAASTEMWAPSVEAAIAASSATLEEREIGGVPAVIATPKDVPAGGPVYLYFHGGAFVFGGGRFVAARAAENADRLGVTVVALDYRMPPEHPFPAAPEDGVATYRALLEGHDPARIVVGGSSAGGNIAAAVALMLRDRGLPLPAGLVLLTPEVDLTEAGDTFRTNALLDVMLKGPLPEPNALYAGGTPLDDPYLSPLMADLAGLPPTLVQAGTRDLFLSNAVLFHRKLRRAGVNAELHVWEAMPHGGFGGATPEDEEVFAEVSHFVRRVCPQSKR